MPRFYKYKYTLMLIKNWPLGGKEFYFLNEHNRTPVGKKNSDWSAGDNCIPSAKYRV